MNTEAFYTKLQDISVEKGNAPGTSSAGAPEFTGTRWYDVWQRQELAAACERSKCLWTSGAVVKREQGCSDIDLELTELPQLLLPVESSAPRLGHSVTPSFAHSHPGTLWQVYLGQLTTTGLSHSGARRASSPPPPPPPPPPHPSLNTDPSVFSLHCLCHICVFYADPLRRLFPELRGLGARGPGTRDQGPGTRDQRPGTRDQGPGTRDQRPGTRDQGPGTRDQGPGTRDPDQTDAVLSVGLSSVDETKQEICQHSKTIKPEQEEGKTRNSYKTTHGAAGRLTARCDRPVLLLRPRHSTALSQAKPSNRSLIKSYITAEQLLGLTVLSLTLMDVSLERPDHMKPS
ncbi:unnamed protein product [Pleuronectes platessa]|uniref:Uncharacterized protein n=1 Tax=Pleuronectes platessa TaxID=8262 RepID=A0A9N7Y1A3_PLEPL|nr:unnamed protein product [Pleuronectes platessa]